MKLYINSNLEICANEKGWPMKPLLNGSYPGPFGYVNALTEYNETLAKAKKESVPIELSNIEREKLGVPCNCSCHTKWDTMHFLPCCYPTIELWADTFIELDIEVEFVRVIKYMLCDEDKKHIRTIARTKPTVKVFIDGEKVHSWAFERKESGFTEGAAIPSTRLPQNPQARLSDIKAHPDFWSKAGTSEGTNDDVLSMGQNVQPAKDQVIKDLRAQLAAANLIIERLKEDNEHYLKLIDKYAGI